MLALASRFGLERFGPAGAFLRRWVPVVLSALPFWQSGQSAYRTLTLMLGAGAAAALVLPPLLVPVAAAFAVRAASVPRALALWFSAVFPVYVVVLWCLSGFNAGLPWAWVGLWRTWFGNEPVSLWIPVCTGAALLAWLGPTRAAGERIGLSFSRFRYPHFAGFPALCVVLTWLLGCYVESAGVAVRSGSVLGIVVVMSFGARIFQRVTGAMRTDTKRLAVSEVQREEPPAPAATRVASLVQTPPAAPVDQADAFAISGSEEMVMPTIPLNVRDGGGFERESADENYPQGESYPQKGDILGPGETLSAKSWQVLDEGGDPDDEDDMFGLMRPTYQKVAAEVEALNAARTSARVLIPIEVEPPVPSLPPEPDLPLQVLETMGPHVDLDDDLSESGLLEAVEPIALDAPAPTPVAAPGVAMSITIDEERRPEPARLPEAMSITIGDSEPLMMEELAADEVAAFDPPAATSAPAAAPVEPEPVTPVVTPAPVLLSPAPVIEPPQATPIAPPATQPAPAASDMPQTAIHEPRQGVDAVSAISNADATTQKRLRSVCIRMISAYTRILSEGGGDAEIARLVAPHLTPEHEALLDQFGGADLRLALEAMRERERRPAATVAAAHPEASAPSTAPAAAEDDRAQDGPSPPVLAAAVPRSVAENVDPPRPVETVVPTGMNDESAAGPPVPGVGHDERLPSVAAAPEPEPVPAVAVQENGPDFDMGSLAIRVPDETETVTDEAGPPAAAVAVVPLVDTAPARNDAAASAPLPVAEPPVQNSDRGASAAASSAPAPAAGPIPAPVVPVEGSGAPGGPSQSPSDLLRSVVSAVPAAAPNRSPPSQQSEAPMQPVFEIDEVVVRPVDEPLGKGPAPAIEAAAEEAVPSEDARAMVVVAEWLATPAVPEVELERLLGDLGRGLPDDMEIEFLARRLAEYEPSPNSFRSLDGHLASLLMRRTEQTYARDDVAMAKGLLSLISSHIYDRWRFGSREQMLARLAFFLCDPFTRRLIARVEAWLKDGFQTQESVRLARAYAGVLESFYVAYPEKSAQHRELTAALDMAEYNFANPAGATVELVHEGLASITSRDVTMATDLARSRLLVGQLPGAAQDGLNQFMKLAGVIDEIDVVIKRESIKHKAPTENHPLHSALMELEFRAVGLINDVHSHLVRREDLFERIPSILRGRNADAAHLFERLRANADAISEAVVESRDRQAAAESSVREIRSLRSEVAKRDEALDDMRKT